MCVPHGPLHSTLLTSSRASQPIDPSGRVLRTLVENADFVLFALDRDGVFTFSDGRGLSLLGLRPAEMVGRSVFEVYRDEQLLLAGARRALSGVGFVQVVELSCHGQAWEIHWVPATDLDGEPAGATAIAHEVSAPQRVEEGLRKLAQGITAAAGEAFVPSVVRFLAGTCQTSAAFIFEAGERDGERLRMLAYHRDGAWLEPGEYELEGMLCGLVHARAPLSLPRGLGEAFPQAASLQAAGYEGFVGVPLFEVTGRPLGVLALLHTRPIENLGVCESLLRIAASRIEAELERLRTERALRRSETQYRLLTEQAWDTIALVSPDLLYTYVSPASTRVTGYAPDELVGRHFEDQIHPDDLPGVYREIARTLASGEPALARYRYRCKDGREAWIETAGCAIFEPATGALKEFQIVSRDVSVRVAAEEALRRSEALLAEAQQLAQIGSFELALPTQVVTWSLQQFRNFGLPATATISRAEVSRLIHPQDRARHEEVVRSAIERAEPFALDYRVVHPDGRVVHLHTIGKPVCDAEGRPVKLVGTSQDITARMRTEQSLQRARQEKDLILQSVGEGLFGLDQAGQLTFINDTGARMLGYAPDELIGRVVTPQPGATGDGLGICIDVLGPQPQEEVFWRKDGSCFLGEYTATPKLEAGRHVGSVVAFRDIGERRRGDAERQQAFLQLRNLSQMQDEFLSTVSHELRTPLVAIQNAVSILAKRRAGELSPEQTRFVTMIGEQAVRLNHLVDNILDSQKAATGRLPCNLKREDVAALVRAIGEKFRHVLESRRIRFTVEVAPAAIEAFLDAERVEQVLFNLLTNAAKFTPEGGSVRLTAARVGDELRVAVSDTGIGIAEAELPHVFTRFYQVQSGLCRGAGGTGLGLAICKEIVEEGHGGRLWAESQPGYGSTFYVALPRRT